jgi:UDP-3-O-[3-hydroxymyristoyl] glucosamine N-acyltransferase
MVLSLVQICDMLEVSSPVYEPARAPLQIKGVSTLTLAAENDLCFAEGPEFKDAVSSSRAGAVIVPEDYPDLSGPLLIPTADPRSAFFQVARLFTPPPDRHGVHARAVIAGTATLGQDVTIGPCAVIAEKVRIGDRCIIGSGCYVGPGVVLGDDCSIAPNVTLHRSSSVGRRCVIHSGTVIGGDGFGYTWDGSRHRKVPQLGCVVIEDDVEIGCSCCIDRATLGETRIRSGTKIDNLVQLGHNTDIGPDVIMVSQAGVAGSSTIGAGAVVAGQAAISDHVRVGPGARIGGQSGVTKDVPDGTAVFGTPARPVKDSLKMMASLGQIPGLLKTIKQQASDLNALRMRLESLENERSL